VPVALADGDVLMNSRIEVVKDPVTPSGAAPPDAYTKAYEVLTAGVYAVSDEYRHGVLDAIKVLRMARALGHG
jgi:hypothetical protein